MGIHRPTGDSSLKMKVFGVLLLLIGAVFCQNDVIDKLGELRATQLLAYIERAGLTDVLRSGGPFTIFAPSDEAIDKLPEIIKRLLDGAPEFLAQVLTFHVTPGQVFSRDLSNEMLLDSLEGSKNRINIYFNNDELTVTATGAPISLVNQEASNGVIHIIDNMIIPLPRQSLFEEVAQDPAFSTLASLVLLAEIDGGLAAPGALTLFAPDNRAFAQVPDDILEGIVSDPERLRGVLLYHVVGGTQFSAGLVSGDYETVQGDSVAISVNDDGSVNVNSATVVTGDIGVNNGVKHIINSVLLPPSDE